MQNLISNPRTVPTDRKTHLQFCERYLEVSNKAFNVADVKLNLVGFLSL